MWNRSTSLLCELCIPLCIYTVTCLEELHQRLPYPDGFRQVTHLLSLVCQIGTFVDLLCCLLYDFFKFLIFLLGNVLRILQLLGKYFLTFNILVYVLNLLLLLLIIS